MTTKDKRFYHNTMSVDALKHGPVGHTKEVLAFHQSEAERYAAEILRKCKNPTYAEYVATALARLVIEANQPKQADWREDFQDSLSREDR